MTRPEGEMAPSGLIPDHRKRPCAINPFGLSKVNFIALDGGPRRHMNGGNPCQRLVGEEGGLNLEKPQPINRFRFPFNALRVMDAGPKHLVSAAQPQHKPAPAHMCRKVNIPPLAANFLQV